MTPLKVDKLEISSSTRTKVTRTCLHDHSGGQKVRNKVALVIAATNTARLGTIVLIIHISLLLICFLRHWIQHLRVPRGVETNNGQIIHPFLTSRGAIDVYFSLKPTPVMAIDIYIYITFRIRTSQRSP